MDGTSLVGAPQPVNLRSLRKESRWITGAEVRARTQWSAQTLRRRVAAGRFPKPIERDRWLESDVDAALSGGAVVSPQDETDDECTVDWEAINKAMAEMKARSREAARRQRRQPKD